MQHVKAKCLIMKTKHQLFWSLVVEFLIRFSKFGNGSNLLHSAFILQVKIIKPEEN